MFGAPAGMQSASDHRKTEEMSQRNGAYTAADMVKQVSEGIFFSFGMISVTPLIEA